MAHTVHLIVGMSAVSHSAATPHLTLLPDTRILAVLEPDITQCLDALGIEVYDE